MSNNGTEHPAARREQKEKGGEEGADGTKSQKIYAFITNYEVAHPITGEDSYEATAITEEGVAITSVIATNVLTLKEELSRHDFKSTYPNARLYWVDNTEEHPAARAYLDRVEDEDQPEAGEPTPSSGDDANIDAIRATSHGCFSCVHQRVCAVATHPLMNELKVSIAACLGHLSEDDFG